MYSIYCKWLCSKTVFVYKYFNMIWLSLPLRSLHLFIELCRTENEFSFFSFSLFFRNVSIDHSNVSWINHHYLLTYLVLISWCDHEENKQCLYQNLYDKSVITSPETKRKIEMNGKQETKGKKRNERETDMSKLCLYSSTCILFFSIHMTRTRKFKFFQRHFFITYIYKG